MSTAHEWVIIDMTERSSRRQFLVQATMIGAAATGVVLRPGPASAESRTGQRAGELTYSDNFHRPDGADVGPGWQQLRGDWSLVGRTLEPTGSTDQMQVAQTAFELGREFTVEGTVSFGPPGSTSSPPLGLVYSGIAFNVQDLGDGTQNAYVFTLQYGPASTWGLFEITGSQQLILPAFAEIDLEANHTYTLRVTARRYGWFDVAILDGHRALVDRSVQLEPFYQQLSGGHFGLYSQAGNADGVVQMHSIHARSDTKVSDPPAPPPAKPLVCTPVQGPPYQLPTTTWNIVGSSTLDQTEPYVAVAQSLLTNGTDQYVMYYDVDRQMTVAHRSTGSDTWVRKPLGNNVPDDGHNSVGGVLDRDGQLHVAGNMHASPLLYYRTSVAGDVTTLTKIDSMVDPDTEHSETYPGFIKNADGALIYTFRGGMSGNGATYYNIYDESSKTWSRLLDQPLFDGQGNGNAYPEGPTLGPDGYFHMVWVWRDTGDAATNHDVCYARTKDLKNWETIGGDPLSLPITPSTKGVVVDPVPIFNGLTNNYPAAGFDAEKRVLVSYYKLDKNLNTQVYIARPTSGNEWQIVQATEWSGRYLPEHIGYVQPPVNLGRVSPLPDGNLQLPYSYAPVTGDSFSGTLIIDPETLLPFTESSTPATILPTELTAVRSTFPGMTVEVRNDFGSAGVAGQRYVLRYEALAVPISAAPYPDPGPMQVYLLQSS